MNMTLGGLVAGFAQRDRGAVPGAAGASVNATVATAFGCPFEGEQPADEGARAASKRYLELGIAGVTLADTTGMANPTQVGRLVARALDAGARRLLTLHFHNTRGLGLANVLAAYQAGARRFDAALGGLGGCPFAPGATAMSVPKISSTCATRRGLRTGLDCSADRLVVPIAGLVGHEVPGQVAKAGRPLDLHPIPERLRRSG